ncbi:hypothetical protein MASR1M107_10450 [Ignavibacteriales bacterium]
MKKLITILVFLFIGQIVVLADWGFYYATRSYIKINFKGTETTYSLFDNGGSTFNGANLGDISALSNTFKLVLWDVKTFKNSGSDVTGGKIYWRIYKQGSTPGSFNSRTASFLQDLGGGNQKWGEGSANVDLPTYLDPGATYKFEVYIEMYGTLPNETKYDNNSGANYIATFTTNSGLPVELTSFNAAIRNGLVDLKWETATEVSNYGFEVERKSANTEWSKIGFVEGFGSTNSPKFYSFSDKPQGNGKISYRLKQIDNDGKYEYSPVVEVLVDNLPNGFVLEQNYPNPFNPETSIRFALKTDTKATIKVYNTLGAEVATLFDGTAEAGRYYDVKFSGNDLSSGFYIYKLVAGDFVSVKKMLLMK